MVAAIALTLHERKDSKHMDPSMQVRVKARDRVEVVKVAVTQAAVAPAPPEPAADSAEKKA